LLFASAVELVDSLDVTVLLFVMALSAQPANDATAMALARASRKRWGIVVAFLGKQAGPEGHELSSDCRFCCIQMIDKVECQENLNFIESPW